MMHRRGYGTWVLWLLLLIHSCTERVDIELDSTYTRLVVNARLTTDSIRHAVLLSTTSDYFSNTPSPRVQGARVELAFNDSRLMLEEHDSIAGLYQCPSAFRGKVGTTYHLRISGLDVNEDGLEEEYQSTATMPGGVVLDSISLAPFSFFEYTGQELYMFALDPPGRNWYNLKFWKNSDLLTDTLIKYSAQSDDFYDGHYLFYGIPVYYYYDDTPREALEEGDTATLELNCIEQAYYDFIVDGQLEIYGNNPLFSGPPANVRSNIDNGAQGVFAVYSVHKASYILKD